MYRIYPEYEHELTNSEDISNYIYGGRGVVKLLAPSGKSHTYIFSKPADTEAFPDDVFFVYALHEGQRRFYVGMIENRQFRLTRNSRFLPDTEIVKGAKHIVKIANNPSAANKMKILHQGVCARCGRKLTTGISFETGIGPKCRKRLEKHVD